MLVGHKRKIVFVSITFMKIFIKKLRFMLMRHVVNILYILI